jgi:hypothetical protein
MRSLDLMKTQACRILRVHLEIGQFAASELLKFELGHAVETPISVVAVPDELRMFHRSWVVMIVQMEYLENPRVNY